MAPAIFGLRLWLVFVCLANLVTVVTFYGWYVGTLINEQYEIFGYPPYVLQWRDYGMIIPSVLLFFTYVYSTWGKKPVISNKYARAVLMLIPGLVLLGISLRQIHFQIENYYQDGFPHKLESFSCDGWADSTKFCVVMQCYFFVPIITGFFVIIEVFVTLFRGPLHPAKGEC